MEAHGSGGPSLEPRVRQLEHAVEGMHVDMGHMQKSLTTISSQVESFTKTLDSVAEKLDVQRTKRPELGALAAVASVILALVGAIMWPAYKRLDTVEWDDRNQQATIERRGEMIGQFSANQAHVEKDLQDLRKAVSEMQSNRFTKQDGQRLEDKIDGLH